MRWFGTFVYGSDYFSTVMIIIVGSANSFIMSHNYFFFVLRTFKI